MTGFLIALLSGALMSVQGVFNTQVTKTTGMWVSNGWVQFSAFLLCAVAWLIAGRDSRCLSCFYSKCMNCTGKDISLWCGNLFYIISACDKCS